MSVALIEVLDFPALQHPHVERRLKRCIGTKGLFPVTVRKQSNYMLLQNVPFRDSIGQGHVPFQWSHRELSDDEEQLDRPLVRSVNS